MKRSHFVYFHMGYWLILWLKEMIFGFQTYNLDELSLSTVVSTLTVKLLILVFPVTIFYTNYLLLVPKLLRKSRLLLYIPAVIALFMLLSPLHQYIYATLLPQNFGWYSYVYLDKLDFWLSFQTLLFENYVYLFFSLAISYAGAFFESQRKREQLEKEQAVTELAYLRSQINPHFLFNTLNDIYALTYQQAQEAPEAVLKLSALLRYMLRESNELTVPISKEIEYLRDVIELFEIGQKGNAFVKLEISGTVAHQQIAPLILINFVENAFKHGISNDPERPIDIHMDLQDEQIYFRVSNWKNQDQKDHTGGIGLANVSRRLALIYPDRHQLRLEENEDTFTIHLTLR